MLDELNRSDDLVPTRDNVFNDDCANSMRQTQVDLKLQLDGKSMRQAGGPARATPNRLICASGFDSVSLSCGSEQLRLEGAQIDLKSSPRKGGPARATPLDQPKQGVKGLGGMGNGLPQRFLEGLTCDSAGLSPSFKQQPQEQSQMEQESCQTLECLKGPLKDKAKAVNQWHRLTQDRLNQIHHEMEVLRQETKRQVSGDTTWYLDIYKITWRNSKSLRWRMVGGTHTLWERVESNLQYLPPSLAQWYREVDVKANLLNALEQVARYELKTINRFAEQGSLKSNDDF
ncbi:MAG: hypothetical protein ACK4F8_11105 [Aquabacterium sp.]